MLACARLSRAAGVTGRRCIATYAIRSPPEALLRDLWQQQSDEEAELPSQVWERSLVVFGLRMDCTVCAARLCCTPTSSVDGVA